MAKERGYPHQHCIAHQVIASRRVSFMHLTQNILSLQLILISKGVRGLDARCFGPRRARCGIGCFAAMALRSVCDGQSIRVESAEGDCLFLSLNIEPSDVMFA